MFTAGLLVSALAAVAVVGSQRQAGYQESPRRLLPSFISKLLPTRPQISSSFSADQQSPQALPMGAPSPLPDAPLLDAGPEFEQLTDESNEIVRGLVEGFLNRQKLQHGEATCLGKGAGKLAGDITAMSANLFEVLERALGKVPHSGSPRFVEGGQGSMRDRARQNEHKEGEFSLKDLNFFGGRRLRVTSELLAMGPGIAMQMGMAVESMVTISHQIVQSCLHKDALGALNKSAVHMRSLQYISGHLVANGQDVVEELADALTAYKAHEFNKFGSDVGAALRKVFLCSTTGAGALPEGLPDEEEVSNITEGFLKGFFGEGSELDVKLRVDNYPAPAVITIDVHQCISDNANFFQAIWAELMWVYAKKVAGVTAQEEMKWGATVAVTMTQLPKALEKCSLGPEEQQMLEDAIKGLASGSEGESWNFRMPEGARVSSDMIEEHMAITAKDWAEKHWEAFGEDLGKLLQEMALTMFSQKYMVDSNGMLQRSSQHPSLMFVGIALMGTAGISFAAIRRVAAGTPKNGDHSHDVASEESAVE